MSFGWLIWHNVWSKKVRSGLTAVAVAIGVMTVVVLGIVTDSLKTTAAGVLQVGAADFTVAQKGVNDILQSALTEPLLKKVSEVKGVRTVTGVLLDTEKLDDAHPLIVEVGIAPEDLKPFGVQIADGRAFTADADNEVMVGIHLAQDLGIKSGDTIKVTDKKMTVVGVFNTGNTFGDSTVMFPLAPFQAFERQPGGLSLLFVKIEPGANVATVRADVEKASPLLVTISSLMDFGRADRSFQLITAADHAATVVAIAVGAIFVMNAMVLSLVERYREFGILRAIGWSRRRVIALVSGEAMIIAFVGAGLGVVLGFGALRILEQLPGLRGVLKPTFQSWVFGRALLTALAVTALGALYPSLRAAQLSPQEAMRRE